MTKNSKIHTDRKVYDKKTYILQEIIQGNAKNFIAFEEKETSQGKRIVGKNVELFFSNRNLSISIREKPILTDDVKPILNSNWTRHICQVTS